MVKLSKRAKYYNELYDKAKHYPLDEAIEILKKAHRVKFDETIEYHANLGVNPKNADQMVRGTLSLPHGTGKTVRVCVFAVGDKAKEAEDAGAKIVGGEELIDRILKENFLDFDVAIATPDIMKMVSKVAKILGPRGMMPNPKVGTVTMEIEKAVKEFSAGKLEYKVDKLGNIHLPVGKLSFEHDKIKENYLAIHREILKAKPKTLKGIYLKNVVITSSMGPGLKLEKTELSR